VRRPGLSQGQAPEAFAKAKQLTRRSQGDRRHESPASSHVPVSGLRKSAAPRPAPAEVHLVGGAGSGCGSSWGTTQSLGLERGPRPGEVVRPVAASVLASTRCIPNEEDEEDEEGESPGLAPAAPPPAPPLHSLAARGWTRTSLEVRPGDVASRPSSLAGPRLHILRPGPPLRHWPLAILRAGLQILLADPASAPAPASPLALGQCRTSQAARRRDHSRGRGVRPCRGSPPPARPHPRALKSSGPLPTGTRQLAGARGCGSVRARALLQIDRAWRVSRESRVE
jgi:hypothetical protein